MTPTCSVLSFMGEHPILTVIIVAIVAVALGTAWTEYLDRKNGEP